jgi:hypothetical protein
MGRIILAILCVGTVGLIAFPLFFMTSPIGVAINDVFDQVENPEGYYEDMNAVRNAKGLERVWFPDSMPESSTQIHELYNRDMGEGWVAFKFQRNDMKAWAARLTPLTGSEIDEAKFTHPARDVDWWPRDLKKHCLHDKNRPAMLEVYKYDHVVTYGDGHRELVPRYLVIQWDTNAAYFWNLCEVEWLRMPPSVP